MSSAKGPWRSPVLTVGLHGGSVHFRWCWCPVHLAAAPNCLAVCNNFLCVPLPSLNKRSALGADSHLSADARVELKEVTLDAVAEDYAVIRHR